MVTVDAYLGLGSRYSYLAFTQFAGIEARHECRIRLIPLSSVELMALRGTSPFRGAPVSGQYDWGYRRRDAEDWAAYYGVPYREPETLPEDHELMARACIAADRQDRLRDYVARIFSAVFVEVREITASVCTELAAACGLDLQRFVRDLEDRATSAQVTANAREALERGVFGVPTFVLGDRMFWGNDRLVLLEHALGQRA